MKPTIPQILPLLKEYVSLPGNGTGGWLHLVIEDGNVSNKDVQWCIDNAQDNGDKEAVKLGKMLLGMSRTQRKKVCGMYQTLVL